MQRRLMLPVALGLSDGILNALTLAASRLTSNASAMTTSLAIRIAIATAVASVFMLFVAEYAQLRRELVRADTQLNVLAPGRMAMSRQGFVVLREALVMASVSGFCALIGSGAPLLLASSFGVGGRVALAAAIIVLALLGGLIAHAVYGSWLRWTAAMAIGGVAVAALGMWLHIV